jgi:hypothetical protein
VFPLVISAALIPMGMTAFTLGTAARQALVLLPVQHRAEIGVVAPHRPDGEFLLARRAVDLDVAGDAADDAPAHRADDAAEERAADHHQESCPPRITAPIRRLIRDRKRFRKAMRKRMPARSTAQCPPDAARAVPADSRPTIFPSASLHDRVGVGHHLASWVEKMKVRPVALIHLLHEVDDPLTGLESRLAVGSSARTICGLPTSARATATRCRCPPESSFGRWLA